MARNVFNVEMEVSPDSSNDLSTNYSLSISNCVQEDSFIIIRKSNIMKAFQVRRDRLVWLGKQKINLNNIIGLPFGSVYEIHNEDLKRIDNSREVQQILQHNSYTENDDSKDNRFLVDDGKSQKMTKEDIELLKVQGASGDAIVEQLIANSATFQEKNEFSQAKYLKKKQLKYSKYLMILKPSTRLLAEMYYAQGPRKILNMRMDSLAQLLTFCNVHSGAQYIVLESCLGLVVGSVLERVGSQGLVVNMYTEEVPQLQTVNMYSFLPNIRRNLLNISIKDVVSLLKEESKSIKTDDEDKNSIPISENCEKNSSETNEQDVKLKRKIQRILEAHQTKKILRQKNFDGLIIAVKYEPLDLLLTLLTFLNISRPFVVFSMYQKPLEACYEELKKTGMALSLRLTEMWMRNYQVLPNRTHPNVNMSGSSGYMLSGIKVAKKKS